MSVILSASAPFPLRRLRQFIPATLLRHVAAPLGIVGIWYWLTAYGYVDAHIMPTPLAVTRSACAKIFQTIP